MFDVRAMFAALRGARGPRNAFERGVAALNAGRYEEALTDFDRAVAEAAGAALAEAQNKRGVVLVELGRREHGLLAFTEALEQDPRCAPALTNIGNILFEDGHLLDAIDYYDAAIRADENYPVARRNLGVAYKRLGRQGDAVRALRAAARVEGRRRPPPG